MIIDKLENIYLYSNLPQEALDFIEKLSDNTNLGKYFISDNVYANIEKYITKKISDAKFEKHNRYIDIQILIKGKENIYYTQANNLNISIPYNSERDIMFYSDKAKNKQKVTLDGSNFVVLYPHEAHAPQVAVDNQPEEAIKVVVKVKF